MLLVVVSSLPGLVDFRHRLLVRLEGSTGMGMDTFGDVGIGGFGRFGGSSGTFGGKEGRDEYGNDVATPTATGIAAGANVVVFGADDLPALPFLGSSSSRPHSAWRSDIGEGMGGHESSTKADGGEGGEDDSLLKSMTTSSSYSSSLPLSAGRDFDVHVDADEGEVDTIDPDATFVASEVQQQQGADEKGLRGPSRAVSPIARSNTSNPRASPVHPTSTSSNAPISLESIWKRDSSPLIAVVSQSASALSRPSSSSSRAIRPPSSSSSASASSLTSSALFSQDLEARFEGFSIGPITAGAGSNGVGTGLGLNRPQRDGESSPPVSGSPPLPHNGVPMSSVYMGNSTFSPFGNDPLPPSSTTSSPPLTNGGITSSFVDKNDPIVSPTSISSSSFAVTAPAAGSLHSQMHPPSHLPHLNNTNNNGNFHNFNNHHQTHAALHQLHLQPHPSLFNNHQHQHHLHSLQQQQQLGRVLDRYDGVVMGPSSSSMSSSLYGVPPGLGSGGGGGDGQGRLL
ncbi:uncharacterized protein EI90DRAFT_1745353 [Cantharellus anzutake]|uniref:uncharacterized protein n=1 Tax=Cantharellus anzutake TaxID=1750568 RepID=UPI00190595C6|nr:uncharacterized protein EI90DRAFT_1745353 [Cantharellus anzutake]KAF8341504.1 hypothetical protein EI90DRAFT_1745353 [Cantharellus anzutake]